MPEPEVWAAGATEAAGAGWQAATRTGAGAGSPRALASSLRSVLMMSSSG